MNRKLFTGLMGLSLALIAAMGISVGFQSLTSQAEAKTPFHLVVDATFPLIIPGATVDLDEGEHQYVESDVYRKDKIGVEPPIGKAIWRGVATGPVGEHGGVYSVTYDFFDKGQVHLAVIFDLDQFPADQGAILGGTGVFRSASGEYSDQCVPVPGQPCVFRATFDFEKNMGRIFDD